MTFLYRHALFVSRKQPYIDWANGAADGEALLDERVSRQERTVYLVAESEHDSTAADFLPEYWEELFEQELSAWTVDEEVWPSPRTRELFDAWFDVELCSGVYDLDSDDPLTQADVDAADVVQATTVCAACGIDIEEGAGRYVGFKVADPQRLESWRGAVLPLAIDEDHVVLALPRPEPSDWPDDENDSDGDLIVRVCSSKCEKVVRRVVPKALRKRFPS
jgi:ribosomal protein L24E